MENSKVLRKERRMHWAATGEQEASTDSQRCTAMAVSAGSLCIFRACRLSSDVHPGP